MPKYYKYMISGYYLYFTSSCIVEAMHVHASDRELTEAGSAKFYVKADGETTVQNRGVLTDVEINRIRKFIKANYLDMYKTWQAYGGQKFFKNK